jgi:hypothetical protein
VFNLFISDFGWIKDEMPKKELLIKGKKFLIPNFDKKSAGDFMDLYDLTQQITDKNSADYGLLIAAVYLKDGEYHQDLEDLEKRKEFFKKYAKMDLFYSCTFFLFNTLQKYKPDIVQPMELQQEAEKVISTLNVWDTIPYLLLWPKVEY